MCILPQLDQQTAYAFFLDFDGTLVELAPTPESIVVPASLSVLLSDLQRKVEGALAIVSGREIAQIDHYLGIDHLVIAGEHGAQWRDAQQQYHAIAVDTHSLKAMHDALSIVLQAHPMWLLEQKKSAFAVHYRAVPEDEALVREVVERVVKIGGQAFEVQPGKMVFEIRPKSMNKGKIVTQLLRMPPFLGRVPIFVGDDVTDEFGFAAVHDFQGISIKVGSQESQAHYRVARVADFLQWLANYLNERINFK